MNYTMEKNFNTSGRTVRLPYMDVAKGMGILCVIIGHAKDQKMDLIICASISRFARNFSDCMTQIAALKTMHPAHPIGVYFETENIYTLNPREGMKLRKTQLSYRLKKMNGNVRKDGKIWNTGVALLKYFAGLNSNQNGQYGQIYAEKFTSACLICKVFYGKMKAQ